MDDDPISPDPTIQADKTASPREDAAPDPDSAPESSLGSVLRGVTMHGSNPIYKGSQK